jgi:hypothetical protein
MRSISAISLCLGALATSMARTENARADFLVICPTGNITARWFGSGEGEVDQLPFPSFKLASSQSETVLRCLIDAPGNMVQQFPVNGQCSGGVEYSGGSSVFGRNEQFRSNRIDADVEVDGDECILRVPLGREVMTLELTEPCESNDDDFSWTCPDDAFPVFRP